MSIYRLGERVPQIDPSAFIHPDAVVIGNVVIGAEASVWPGAVLRGDYGEITIGSRTSIQDGSVIHTDARYPTVIGASCIVGHLAHLEGCTVEDECMVGSGSVVLHRAVVGRGATVGANAVVTDGTVIPPGALAVGIPVRIIANGSKADVIRGGVALYVDGGRMYTQDLEQIG